VSKKFILIFGLLSVTTAVCAETVYLKSPQAKIVPVNGVIKGQISLSKEVPEEFYGSWSVNSELIDTNNPEKYRARSSDVWVLSKSGQTIILSNPSTGANAAITVQDVKGNTATFRREERTDTYREVEEAKLTIDGDRFYGTDILVTQYFSNGVTSDLDIVKYKIEGRKISGPALKKIFSGE